MILTIALLVAIIILFVTCVTMIILYATNSNCSKQSDPNLSRDGSAEDGMKTGTQIVEYHGQLVLGSEISHTYPNPFSHLAVLHVPEVLILDKFIDTTLAFTVSKTGRTGATCVISRNSVVRHMRSDYRIQDIVYDSMKRRCITRIKDSGLVVFPENSGMNPSILDHPDSYAIAVPSGTMVEDSLNIDDNGRLSFVFSSDVENDVIVRQSSNADMDAFTQLTVATRGDSPISNVSRLDDNDAIIYQHGTVVKVAWWGTHASGSSSIEIVDAEAKLSFLRVLGGPANLGGDESIPDKYTPYIQILFVKHGEDSTIHQMVFESIDALTGGEGPIVSHSVVLEGGQNEWSASLIGDTVMVFASRSLSSTVTFLRSSRGRPIVELKAHTVLPGTHAFPVKSRMVDVANGSWVLQLYGGDHSVFRSSDQGEHWIAEGLPPDNTRESYSPRIIGNHEVATSYSYSWKNRIGDAPVSTLQQVTWGIPDEIRYKLKTST